MDFVSAIAFFSIAFISSAGLMPLVIKYARKKGLTEENNARKTHQEKVSNLGGTSIFAGCALTVFFILQPDTGSPVMAFALGLPLLLLGILDDIFKVGITTRLVLQAVLAAVLFEMGFQFVLLEDFWLINLAATVLMVLMLINAYNFIDGINGLAGGLGLVASVFFGYLLTSKGAIEIALVCFAYAGSLLGFLSFNFGKKARIFMGDNGSTVLGFFMAIMILANMEPGDGVTSEASNWPLLLSAVAIPVADIFKVALFRFLRQESPFKADRTHIHHLLTDRAISHPAACGVLVGWTILTMVVCNYLPEVLQWQFVLAAMSMPYLLALGISLVKNLKPAPSSVPAQGRTTLHNLQAN